MRNILPDLCPQQFSSLLLSSDSDPVQALPTHTVFMYLRTGDLPAEKLYLALVLPYIFHSSKFTVLHSFICPTSFSYSVFYTCKILCLQTVVKMWLTYAKIEFIKILSMLVESTGINSGKNHGR